MKEITIKIPDESSELVIELIERLGGSVEKKERISKRTDNTIKKCQKKVTLPAKKLNKQKIDHTYLFGKWKDFDINARKLRKESWGEQKKVFERKLEKSAK